MPSDFKPRAYQGPAVDFMLNTPRCALWAGMGLGKEQPVSEPVLTPSGWRPIGDLVPGDYVYGSSGASVRVMGVFPQGVKDVFRLAFTDGSWTRAGAEHLWSVRTPRQKYDGHPGKVLSTEEIMRVGLRDAQGNLRFGIPLTAPIQRPETALPIEPYLMGVLLGDGCVRPYGAVSITSDDEILDNWDGRYESHESCGIGTRHLSTPVLRASIKILGLAGKRSWEKHVPEKYLFGSVGQRLALLQGLLDTDGHPMADGGIEFCSTAEPLVDAVVFLSESLGGIARNKKDRITKFQGGFGRKSWRINVKLPAEMEPFRLRRKLDKWVRPTKYPPVRMLASVTPDGREESVCIAVDAVDHLYVTRHHILTHNTTSVLTALDALYLAGESAPTLVLAPLRVARSTWGAEVKKWNHLSGLEVVPIVGTAAERARALQVDAPVFTTNYENLEWLTEKWGDRWPYKIVVADEATKLKSVRLSFQTSSKGKEFLRGQGGKRARALGKIAHSHTTRFIELTGTPAPNGLKDLWGQIWFLDGGRRLGRSYEAFKQRWFETDYDGRTLIPREHAEAQIHAALADLCLTIDAKDYFDLKDPIVNVIKVQLPPAARKLYKEMEKEMFAQIAAGRTASAVNAAGKTQKCLSGDTETLTSNGWKRLKEVNAGRDAVWDGVEWVYASGLCCNGVQEVLTCWGVTATPDHLILTDQGWRTALEIVNGESSERPYRASVRLPYGVMPGGENTPAHEPCDVAMPMCVRGGGCADRAQLAEEKQGREEVLRLPAEGNDLGGLGYTRDDRAPYIPLMVRDGATMYESELKGLGKLRWSWGSGVCAVASLLRQFRRRYAPIMAAKNVSGAQGQQRTVLPGKLQVGVSQTAGEQHPGKRLYQYADRAYNRSPGGETLRCEGHNDTEADGKRLAGRETAGPGTAEVYDLINAGPRHRFTVRGADGVPFLAHNCLQLSSGAIYLDPDAESDADPKAKEWREVHEAKLEALDDVIEEACGAPVIVVYEFRSDLERLKRAFPQGRALVTTRDEEDFKAGKIPVLFTHPKCLGADTQVLTERRGWVNITDVERTDRVFDGVEFVSHSGCKYSGYEYVVNVLGITMTPTHRLLIGGEWVEAQNVRDNREVRVEALQLRRYASLYSESSLHNVRPGVGDPSPKRDEEQPGRAQALRGVPEGFAPQPDRHEDIRGLEGAEVSGERPVGQKLWRTRNRYVPLLGGVQELLRRYARRVLGQSDDRTDRRERRLLERELHLGHEFGTAVQQAEQSRSDVPGRGNALGGIVPEIRRNEDDVEHAPEPGHVGGRSRGGCAGVPLRGEPSPEERASPRKAHVYDLVDCGPRNRFVIRNAAGEVYISHNSAGHGIDGFQYVCNQMVFFTRNWSLEDYQQIVERIGPVRQMQAGMDRPVFLHHIVAEDTVDELVAERLEGKRDVQEILLSAMKRRS